MKQLSNTSSWPMSFGGKTNCEVPIGDKVQMVISLTETDLVATKFVRMMRSTRKRPHSNACRPIRPNTGTT